MKKAIMPQEDAFKCWRDEHALWWSRLKTVGVLEVAAFAGWYALFHDSKFLLAAALMIPVLILLVVLWRLMWLDRNNAYYYWNIYRSYNPNLVDRQRKFAGWVSTRFGMIVLVFCDAVLMFYSLACALEGIGIEWCRI